MTETTITIRTRISPDTVPLLYAAVTALETNRRRSTLIRRLAEQHLTAIAEGLRQSPKMTPPGLPTSNNNEGHWMSVHMLVNRDDYPLLYDKLVALPAGRQRTLLVQVIAEAALDPNRKRDAPVPLQTTSTTRPHPVAFESPPGALEPVEPVVSRVLANLDEFLNIHP